MAVPGGVKELQEQVDKLKERLDFMAPMMSLLNFTQDYFQKVECEASVQLLRLKNARASAVTTAAGKGVSNEDEHEPESVDTAKWLHAITDLVLFLQGECSPTSPGGSSPKLAESMAEVRRRSKPTPSTPVQAEVSPSRHGAAVPASPVMPEAHRAEAPFGSLIAPGAQQTSQEASSLRGAGVIPVEQPVRCASSPRGAHPHRAHLSQVADASPFYPVRQQASSPSRPRFHVENSEPPSSEFGGGPAEMFSQASLPMFGSSASSRQRWPSNSRDPRKEGYGAHGAGDQLQNTLQEFGGLALGKGSWANACRQAAGPRRDALRLLCTSGIVTERELADDLTVISEEHIEECVSIALEMLQRWPAAQGPPPQAEANAYFRKRLEALYMKRAPSPFG